MRRVLWWLVVTVAVASFGMATASAAPQRVSSVADSAAGAAGRSLTVQPTVYDAGTPVAATGRVPHGPRKVRVQYRVDSAAGWTTVARGRAKASGRFTFAAVVLPAAPQVQVRVLAPRVRHHGTSVRKAVTPVRMVGVRVAAPVPPPDVPTEVLLLVNQHRSSAGCGPLTAEAHLQAAAQGHSADMAATGQMSHVGSDGSAFYERALAAGYPGSPKGESIASGFTTAQPVVDAWMANTEGPVSDRSVLLDCTANDIGVGVAAASGGTQYWTLMTGYTSR